MQKTIEEFALAISNFGTSRLVVQCLNHYVTPDPYKELSRPYKLRRNGEKPFAFRSN